MISLILLISIDANAYDELIVLGDVGKTTPASEYYNNVSLNKVRVNEGKVNRLLLTARKGISEDIFFPLTSAKMRPGFLKGHRFKSRKKGVKPFAVVGMDELSKKWLEMRKDKLIELKAPIFVVEARSVEQIKSLPSLFKGLKFVAANGDGLATDLRVNSYPFLVMSSGVWQ